MVSFVKPNLLGTSKEFRNRFVNPITNGQCADSTAHDVKIMKRRAHILHEKLNGCVQVQFTVQFYCSKEIIYSSHQYSQFLKKKVKLYDLMYQFNLCIINSMVILFLNRGKTTAH